MALFPVVIVINNGGKIKNWWEKFKKWREIMLAVAINSICQKERIEINLKSTKRF